LLNELCDVAVPLAAPRARLELVRDVADENVLERPLLVALDPGHGISADQVASLESGQDAAQGRGIARDALERTPPEDPADDRRIEYHVSLLHWERVEACGDEPSDGRGESLGPGSAFVHHGCELLDEQRVAFRRLGHL